MSTPGTPARDAAGAACRNAAELLDEMYDRVQGACHEDAPTEAGILAAAALYCIDKARLRLNAAADAYYHEEAPK